MPLLFLPIQKVFESAGAPKGAAAQFKWLVREILHIDRLPMTDKTLRKALSSQTHTPRTSTKLADLNEQIAKGLGMKSLIADVPSEVVGTRLCWHEWLHLANCNADNLPADFLPHTRDYIRKLALYERQIVQALAGCGPDCERAVVRLINNRLTRKLCTEIPAKTVIRQIRDMRTKEDYLRFLPKHSLFLRWLTHCRISLLMDILALADIEYYKTYLLPENATAQKLHSVSMVAPILPGMRDGKLALPIPLLFERFKNGKRIPSWILLARYIGGCTSLRAKYEMLKRWRRGKPIPSVDTIKCFLDNLIQHERLRADALRRYRVALLLTNLHAGVKRTLPEVYDDQRLQMFHTFHGHRRRHLRILR